MKVFVFAATAALLFGAGEAAIADASLSYADAGGKAVSAVYVRGDKVRVERTADGFAMIADTGAGVLTMIDHRQRSFTVMDRAAIESMNAQMKQMQEMMKAQLANLSEDQRKTLDARMPGLAGAGGGVPQPEAMATGERRTVAGYACEMMEMTLAGRTLASSCITPAAALGLSARDASTMQAMAQLLEELGRGGGGQMSAMIKGGVPVQNTNAHNGKPETLAKVEHDEVAASWFVVPDGYKRREMPQLGMPATQ